jgi:hypothetical protein
MAAAQQSTADDFLPLLMEAHKHSGMWLEDFLEKFKTENNLTSDQLMMMCAASKTRNLSWMLDISMALERT